ncbi:MAG: glycosyltransferase [Verrucomicrobia bacterium]|nr:glycosyltransferase [Verrucomicrobiota bacterium]
MLQHPHRADEISGVMTYCESARDALQPLGVEAVIISTHGLTTGAAWRAVREVDVVHLNSNHIRLALFARLQRKPVLIKYHYPFWDEIVEGEHEPRGLGSRFVRDTGFNWRLGAGKGLLAQLKHSAERFVRAVLRVFVARVVNARLACSQFIARSSDLPWRVELDYNPFAFPELPPREATAVTSRPGFVFAGRLDRTKGADLLLAAAARLRNRGNTFHLDLIGKGDDEENLHAQAKQLGLEGMVKFWGQLPRDVTVELMRQSLAVVVPSRWNDPAPYVIVEAASVGRCAIGARRGGIAELIGPAGFLFDSENVDGLMHAMGRLLTQPGESRRRGAVAFDHLHPLCNSETAGRRLLGIYGRLLRRPARQTVSAPPVAKVRTASTRGGSL